MKKQVLRFWEEKLCEDAWPRLSLVYFKPQYMSLSRPHPIFSTAGSSPYEVTKAGIQALFLSGRYRDKAAQEALVRQSWGILPLPILWWSSGEGRLGTYPSLSPTRKRLYNFTINYARAVPAISETILDLTKPTQPLLFQFLLDCSVIPRVISLVQEHGEDVLHHLFKVSRTWCYSLHRDRLKILGRWTPWL